jgi:RNA polymerase sigma factor (sigma-70 family)
VLPDQIKRHAPTRDQAAERELVAAARRSADGRERLVAAFVPLIAGAARAYRNVPGVERSELMQEGVVGLLRALQRYDAEQGTPFWAYASWWVRQAMQEVVSELSGPVVLSDRAARQLARVKRAELDHLQSKRSEASAREVARRTGLATVQVERLRSATRRSRAIDEPAVKGAGEALVDTIPDPVAEDRFARVTEWIAAEELPRLLAGLGERARMIVCARYGVGCEQRTLREIGVDLGVSAERVRQIERDALATLGQACWARAQETGVGA